ncbi:MAG: magnesium chelatase domain-containing protein [Chakrabartia sp.]
MVTLVETVAYLGLEARTIEVQCQIATGVPAFVLVGLPDKAVAERRERVRAAIAAMGLALPPKRITINLSPADMPKEGSHYDLPIAMSLLGAMGIVDVEHLAAYYFIGELGLDGRIIASPGVLQAARYAGHGFRTNAEIDGAALTTACALEARGRDLLAQAANALKLSARGFGRVLRVSRTIADLADSAKIMAPHLAEALSYRRFGPLN